MKYRILLAGASGVIGRRLTPLLVGAGHRVTATTRSTEKVDALRAMGAEPLVVDVFDADRLIPAVVAARPEVVIHQLTDLPKDLDPALMEEALKRNARIRDEGTRKLVRASIAAGARRLVAQSIAWVYTPGPEPHDEADPLDVNADGSLGVTVRAIVALERLTLNSSPLDGVVLRYGQLYGPGTTHNAPTGRTPLHVDAAAHAALLAVEKGATGTFNLVERDSYATARKARSELGWDAGVRFST